MKGYHSKQSSESGTLTSNLNSYRSLVNIQVGRKQGVKPTTS